MTHEDLIKHYGSGAEVARALRVSPQVVSAWKTRESIPIGWQQAIEAMTGGILKRDDSPEAERAA